PEQARAFLGFFLQTMEMEHPATRKIIAAVPDGGKGYKPDDKARTGHELAWHLATAEIWFMDGILNGAFSMDGGEPATPATIGEIMSWYDSNYKDRVAKLKALPAEKLVVPIPFFGMAPMPAVMYLSFLTLHTAHHRGQLSTYLRPMGSKVPSIYGGSADEP